MAKASFSSKANAEEALSRVPNHLPPNALPRDDVLTSGLKRAAFQAAQASARDAVPSLKTPVLWSSFTPFCLPNLSRPLTLGSSRATASGTHFVQMSREL
jgi:hypothetical protein